MWEHFVCGYIVESYRTTSLYNILLGHICG